MPNPRSADIGPVRPLTPEEARDAARLVSRRALDEDDRAELLDALDLTTTDHTTKGADR